MHVAYIHQHFSTKSGASGTRSYEMAQRLLSAGHNVTMISGAGNWKLRAEEITEPVTTLDVDGIRVLRVNQPYSNRMGYLERIQAFMRFARVARRLVIDSGADLVFASSTPLTVGIPAMKAKRRLGLPFVFEVRDLWPELPIAMGVVKNPVMKWYLGRLERRIYAAADWIVALSPGMKEGIAKTGYPAERITMVPNASDLDLFRPTDERLADDRFGSESDLRLVFTGAHGMANGLDSVLDAAGVLKRRGVGGVRFVFIGDGKLKPQLQARVEREGLGGLTAFCGLMPKVELARLLPRMDVGMMILKNVPAFYYGTSPNKFFDYIASGIPVLNNYPGWLAEMIEAHGIGRVVPPDDPEAFADAVVWFLEHRDGLVEMGRRGRLLAESEFSRDELGRRFVEVLEGVHGGRFGV